MILRAPTLVTARNYRGWERPVDFGQFNYRDVFGKPANINGIAEWLPAGCDIAPFVGAIGTVQDTNLMCIGRYTAPTRCTFYIKREGNVFSYKDTDCELKDEAGNSLHGIGGTYSSFGAGIALGTPMRVTHAAATIANNIFTVYSMRGAVARVTRYEGGADGVVTIGMRGDDVSPVVAERISDNSEQIIALGQAYCRPGKAIVYLDATTAGGTYNDLVWEVAIDFEVPYGL